MSGLRFHALPMALLAVLLLAMLCLLLGSVSALPGDLTGEIELEEYELEAEPQLGMVRVSFNGNATFDQPIWQQATASFSVEIDRNWTAAASPVSVSNRGPGTQSFSINVDVPTSSRGGEVATVRVVAEFTTRFGDPSSMAVTGLVRVVPWVGYRVNVTDALELVLPQGTSGTLRVPLRNLGNVADAFASSVPYWYGLRPLGLTVESPGQVTVEAKDDVELEFPIRAADDTVPRMYVFELVVDAASLPRGGEGPTEDPRSVLVEVHVTGVPPEDDPYKVWSAGDPSDPLSRWGQLFSASAQRSNPYVDPTGTYIVYDQVGNEERLIYLGELSGSGTRPLTRGHTDHHPVISPNGQMVAFARAPDRIIIVNHNGTELMEFGTESGWVNLTDWSPSNDRILFDSSGDIFELDLRYNTTRRLTGEPVDQWGAVYSTDGGRIFYLSFESAGPRAEVWTMTSDGSAHRQLTFNELEERSVSVSPNGNKLAFTLEEKSGRGDRVCVMNTDGSGVRYFSDLSRDVFGLRWHPKGDRLVAEVSSRNTTSHDLERISYPWKDAGASDGGGGNGNGGGDSAVGWWDDLTGGYGNYILLIVGIVIVAAIVGNYHRHRTARKKEEAAEELRQRMEAEERARWEQARQEIEAPPRYDRYGRY